MSFAPEDRVLESTATTGTGPISLAGAVTGFRRFNTVCAIGDIKVCMVEAVDANGVPSGDWQTGAYQYTAANELTLVEFYESSTGSAVSWAAGTKYVSISQSSFFTNTFGRTWALARGFALP